MFQEIITYMIIAVAIAVAIRKLYSTFAIKKRNKETLVSERNCADCIAECNVRDASFSERQEKSEFCETMVKKATDS
jgi:hypothetical protein